MPLDIAQNYYKAIDIIESDELAKLAVASSVHSMSKSGRDKYFKGLNKTAKLVKSIKSDKILTAEEAALILARQLNGR